jgi:hypothetical protein
LPRTEITADEIRRAFGLPPGTELTFKFPSPNATRQLVERLDVGVGVPCLAEVESDPTFICG